LIRLNVTARAAPTLLAGYGTLGAARYRPSESKGEGRGNGGGSNLRHIHWRPLPPRSAKSGY
jgi:hypothetical protein